MRLIRAAVLAAAALALAGCGGGSGGVPLHIAAEVVTPPRGAVVDAREWGSRDVGLARKGDAATVSVVGPQGHGVSGLAVRIDGRRAAPCGAGCYRAPAAAGPVVVRIGAHSWRFAIPASAPSGTALVAAATRAYARLKTVSLWQSLASGPTDPVVARFLFVAPDRLRYSIVGGSQAVVIGTRRWDRPSATGAWKRSPQDRVNVMHVPWGNPIDARVVAPRTVTFFDLSTRAWFRVVLDSASKLPTTVGMTGISHFMVDRFSGFDAPARIDPPTG